MLPAAEIALRIEAQLGSVAGPTLVLAPPQLARALLALAPDRPLALVASGARRPRPRAIRALAALQAHPLRLPVAPRSLAAIAAVRALARPDADPREEVRAWTEALQSGGRLVVVEKVAHNPLLLALSRVLRPGHAALAAEDLTGLFLDAGLGDIRQVWLSPAVVLTSGARRAVE